MRDKIIGFIISVVCFIISLGFVKGQAMALPFVPTDWTWEMYQGLHMLGDLIANDVNFEVPDWVDFNDFDDVKLFLENIYNEGKKKVAYASIIADLCVGTWENFLVTGEVDLGFSEQNIKRVHNTGFFQHIVDTITSQTITPDPDVNYLSYLNKVNDPWFNSMSVSYGHFNYSLVTNPISNTEGLSIYRWSTISYPQSDYSGNYVISTPITFTISGSGSSYNCTPSGYNPMYCKYNTTKYLLWESYSAHNISAQADWGEAAFVQNYAPNMAEFTFTNVELSTILNSISKQWRNVNIYVNGVPWTVSSLAPSIDNPLGVVIPDNTIDDIQVGDTKGHVISATLPDTDNLVGSIDLGVVMDELREAQAQGREATLEKVKTKQGVRAIDGSVVDTKTKAVAIDVPVVSSVVASADDFGYIPYYPEIPSAFSGTTILSELIDATQNIIPNELIMAIWGLVIILFIIALINIFHK